MTEQKYSPYNLIVNFLPQSLSDEEFANIFGSVGAIKSCKIIRDKSTYISYGFGFVEYVDESDSAKAIEALDGLPLQNKKIKVAYARQGENIKGANVYIKYLPKNFDNSDLEKLFTPFGHIISARVLMDQHTGMSRGVGFVLFNTRDEATNAVENMNGRAPPGYTQALSVKFAEDNKAQKMQQHAMMMGLLPGTIRPNTLMQAGLPLSQQRARIPTAPNAGLLGRPQIPTVNNFGVGYQGVFGGGPLRSNNVNQRYNPMSSYTLPGASNVTGQVGDLSAAFPSNEYVLFVYNIGVDTDERALWQLFQPFGAIKKIAVVQDKDKNRGKNYGFVTMYDYQEAMAAIQHLNGLTYAERPLQVSLKKPKSNGK